MSLNLISAGKNIPEDIYVIIEIPANHHSIKYEINKENGILFVDRFIPTAMYYPCNYGYINNTLSLDGDPVDVLVPTSYSIFPGSVIRCRPIGMLTMTDESGEDSKIVAVPHSQISKEYDCIQDIYDFPHIFRNQIVHFFKHYKDLESKKWIKVNNWENAKKAKNEIMCAFQRAKQ